MYTGVACTRGPFDWPPAQYCRRYHAPRAHVTLGNHSAKGTDVVTSRPRYAGCTNSRSTRRAGELRETARFALRFATSVSVTDCVQPICVSPRTPGFAPLGHRPWGFPMVAVGTHFFFLCADRRFRRHRENQLRVCQSINPTCGHVLDTTTHPPSPPSRPPPLASHSSPMKLCAILRRP